MKIDDEVKSEVKLLKALMSYYVFESPALLSQQAGHRTIIRTLFDAIFEATGTVNGKPHKNRALIPPRFHSQLEGEEIKEHHRGRCAADVVASMSEEHALKLYQRITAARAWKHTRPDRPLRDRCDTHEQARVDSDPRET